MRTRICKCSTCELMRKVIDRKYQIINVVSDYGNVVASETCGRDDVLFIQYPGDGFNLK
jgi:hypothetical protein